MRAMGTVRSSELWGARLSRVDPPPRERSTQALLKGQGLGQLPLTRLRRSPSKVPPSPAGKKGRQHPETPLTPHRAPGHCATRRGLFHLSAGRPPGAAPGRDRRSHRSPHGCPFPPPSPPPRHGPRPTGTEGPGAVPAGPTPRERNSPGAGRAASGREGPGSGGAAGTAGPGPARRLFPPGPAVPRACPPRPARPRSVPGGAQAGRVRGRGGLRVLGTRSLPRSSARPSPHPAARPQAPGPAAAR